LVSDDDWLGRGGVDEEGGRKVGGEERRAPGLTMLQTQTL